MSMPISKLRSDEYTDKILYLSSYEANGFVLNKCNSLRKILESKSPKTDQCDTPVISYKKVLYTLLIWTVSCF